VTRNVPPKTTTLIVSEFRFWFRRNKKQKKHPITLKQHFPDIINHVEQGIIQGIVSVVFGTVTNLSFDAGGRFCWCVHPAFRRTSPLLIP
jgi:hypothetical protein